MKTPISRRIFYWTLVVSYVCITTTVLLTVFGYTRDFSKEIFVYTGSITVKSNPETIQTIVDSEKPKSRLINVINDSYYIRGLRPRTYDLRVSTEGYKDWQKSVSVHSGISTEFWNIILLRDHYDRTSYDIDKIDRFFPAPEENLFAITRQLGKTQTITVFDTDENQTLNTFIFTNHIFSQNQDINIEWSPDSTELIIPLENVQEDGTEYAIAYNETNSSFLLSENISLPNIHAVRWDPKEKNAIYFLSDTNLYRTEILEEVDDEGNQNIAPEKIFEDVLAYDFTDDGIYLFTKNQEILYDFDVHAKEFETLTTFETPKSSKNIRLIAYDNHRFLILDDDAQELHVYNKGDLDTYSSKLGNNIVGAHFSDDGKKLLFHSPFEIFTYFTREWKDQPIRQENQQQSLIRFSQELGNVHFAKDYEHVMYTVGDELKITEFDYRGNRNTDTITQFTDTKNTVINKHKKGRLYFIDSSKTEDRILQSIEFPEKETFF